MPPPDPAADPARSPARSPSGDPPIAAAVRTTCPYCGVGCGVKVRAGAPVEGDPEHPANFGRLCSKGAALDETLGLEGRLLAPRVDGRDATWDEAIGRVAAAFSNAIRDHGPDSVAIYGSGQLLTEDYYVANKFMKGFVGSANIDTNSRLCMASTVAGHQRAFGADMVPGVYEDLEAADLVVLVGSNLAWCHPVLYQRLAAAKAARPGLKVVAVDPRRTATNDLADLHLALAPGTDVALFHGLLAEIARRGALDHAYLADHVEGLEDALAAARAADPAATEVPAADLAAFHDLWIGREKVVTVFSQGVNQSTSGVDKVGAIINCHLATGRIGRPGMGPFSVTGQPNAMGGREVGGLASMLACHLDIGTKAHREAVRAHWKAPTIAARPGLKAVDLFRACRDGRIRALWIMSTNPVVSMPEADLVREALAATPFVAVSDILPDTDTGAMADVLLPALGWGEKSGTVTNSERVISRQRAFAPAPGAARADWRIVADVAAAMGWGAAFAYDGPADVFREHAALSGVAAGLGGDFDISGLADLTDEAYEALPPMRWPVTKAAEALKTGGRFYAEGGFHTPTRKARMVAPAPRPLAAPTNAAFPLRLNTGRVRDQWHTMTRTGRTARLTRHIAEPYLEIHPEDAAAAGLAPATLARVESEAGAAILRVLVTDRVRRGEVFAPMHWTGRFSGAGRVSAAIPAAVDPVSGQPELKGAVCRAAPFAAAWYGFVAARGPAPAAMQADYWALAPADCGWRAEVAGLAPPEDWIELAEGLVGGGAVAASLIDEARGLARIAFADGDGATGVFFAARGPVALSRGHVIGALAAGAGAGALLAGGPGAGRPDPGRVVCSCNDVGANTIIAAAAAGGLSLDDIGAATGAGAVCGSCRPEIRALLDAEAAASDPSTRIAAE